MNYQFQFKNKKTGVKVIAQSWDQCFDLQRDPDYIQTYRTLGEAPDYRLKNDDTYKQNEKLNKFWEGAQGFEKVGKVNCSGIFIPNMFSSIRMFLRSVHNHACMQGDVNTAKRAKDADRVYYRETFGVSVLLIDKL